MVYEYDISKEIWSSALGHFSPLIHPVWDQKRQNFGHRTGGHYYKLIFFVCHNCSRHPNPWSSPKSLCLNWEWHPTALSYDIIIGHPLILSRWFLDQLTKIDLTHQCDEICRAIGPRSFVSVVHTCLNRKQWQAEGFLEIGRIFSTKSSISVCKTKNLIECHLCRSAALQPISLLRCTPCMGNAQRVGLRPRFSRNTVAIYFLSSIFGK